MVDCYRSQLPCLGARAEAAVTGPEVFHRLSDRAPPGHRAAPRVSSTFFKMAGAGVAVVIPTYNRCALLVEAVRSVLDQSYRDISCLVVDNGSTDGTAEALAELGDTRLKLLRSDRPLGGPAARNLGIAAAEGAEWVAFLDSDDIWAPTKLERQLAALAAFPGSGWSATACVNVDTNIAVRQAGRLVHGPPAATEATLFSTEELRALLLEENLVPAGNSTVLVSRELLQEAKGYDTRLSTCDDWDLWLRLASKSALAYVDRPLAGYRIWDGQQSFSNESAFVRDAGTVRARNFPDAGPVPHDYSARWEREAARRNVSSGRRLAAARNYLRAARIGLAPGQLAYAVAAVTAPQLTERRLRRLDSVHRLPEGWVDQVEPWLAPYRQTSGAQALRRLGRAW